MLLTQNKKNVLIVSASIGSGHEQAAKAIKEELQSMHIKAKVVDFMAGSNLSVHGLIKETYLKIIDYAPSIYHLLYRWSHKECLPICSLLAVVMKRRLQELINHHSPDMIVFTHPFPCAVASYMKRQGRLNIPFAGVVTDYAVHRLWVYNEVDMYFVATEELKGAMIERGITSSCIHVTGIPIMRCFNKAEDRSVKEANHPEPKPSVLIMGGGLGLGDLDDVLQELDKMEITFNITVVTGKNERLRRELMAQSKKLCHETTIVGYTNKIDALMDNCDILITKPGALTCSEAIALRVPMVLYNAIPGHEEDNARWFREKGAALWAHDAESLKQSVAELLTDHKLRTQIIYNAEQLRRPLAAKYLVNEVIKYMLYRSYGRKIVGIAGA